MSGDSLSAIFRPKSIAVIGASRSRGGIGGEVFHNLVSNGFCGPVYPVNSRATHVESVRAYRSIADVPDPVDLAVVAVPHDQVLEVVDACASKGVRGLVVLSAGFAETGPAGRALQDELLRRVRAHGMRMVGPNCLGVLSTDPAVRLDATFAPTFPPAGNVAFASQSGAFGLAVLDLAQALGIGISQFASTGNKADVSGNDLLEAWEDDPRTSVILLYLESLGNPTRFMQIARRVGRKKPIAVVKAGRSQAGARAASSHTGALAGMDVAVDALLGQAGVLRAETIEELFDLATLLANQPVPRGRRIAILTNAGGPAILASDACESHGLSVGALSPATVASLTALLPPEASSANPVDMIASADAATYERALGLLLIDDQVDAVLTLFVPPLVTEAEDVARAIRRAAVGSPKPIAACLMGSHGISEALSVLREGRIPTYRFPEPAAIALARAARHGEWLQRLEGRVPDLTGISPGRARAVLERRATGGTTGRWLAPREVREVLEAYGVPIARTAFASDGDGAAAVAAEIGFPVALKIVSETIVHKTDVGGVEIHLADERAVREAYGRMRARLVAAGRSGEVSGVLVQEMVLGGVETFVGVTHEPTFGSLVAFGIGGTAVEVFGDVVFRVAPVTDLDAAEMIEAIRGRKLLEGFRGAPPADRDAIADAILRVSRLVGDLPEVVEMDVNPLVAFAPGKGVIAVDARIRVC